MSSQTLTNELALRIGLAARVLPDTDPRRLMGVLVEKLKMPLTEDKLAQLTVRQLREAADGAYAEVPVPMLKSALDLLWGKASIELDDGLPTPQPLADGEMPNSVRVAIASNSGERLDGHFGTCARFLIYQVSSDEVRLVDVRSTASSLDAEDKNAARAELIRDSHVLYVVSIGGPAAAKVVKNDVHPIKVPDGGEAAAILADMQGIIGNAPPPWLAKVMGLDAEQRVRFERTEEDA